MRKSKRSKSEIPDETSDESRDYPSASGADVCTCCARMGAVTPSREPGWHGDIAGHFL